MQEAVVIIAEAGVNHNGSIDLAKQLIDVAAEAGVDYIKFQTFRADKIASKVAVKAEYQKKTTGGDEGQLQMLKKLELSYDDHIELINYCREKSVSFLSTPFDLESIDLLKELGINIGKIPSGEITNRPYLLKMARSFNQLILSTGMADRSEVEQAINVLIDGGARKEDLVVLHCNTEYPTPYEDVNLHAMTAMGREFSVRVGYSDHTEGIEVPIAAVALGASMIEKHFTLDRSMEGPDHKASLEPAELVKMVRSIRNIEKALGSALKTPSPSEIKNRTIARKSLVALRDLPAGHVLTEEDITTKRPGTGISPMLIDKLLGRKLLQPIKEDDLFTPEHINS
jgi:N,N'-diacetyllegionaminate synthase